MNRKNFLILGLIILVLIFSLIFLLAIPTLFAGWTSTTTREVTYEIDDKLGAATDCSNSAIAIRQLTVKSNGDYEILVSNVGSYDFTNIDAEIMFKNGSLCESSKTSLKSGKDANLTVSDCDTMITEPSQISKAVVSTDCGGVTDSITGYDTKYITIE
jgi:hypothetical protein